MFVALLLVALLANIAEASTHTSRVRTLNITNFDKEVQLYMGFVRSLCAWPSKVTLCCCVTLTAGWPRAQVALGREKGYFVATEAPWCSRARPHGHDPLFVASTSRTSFFCICPARPTDTETAPQTASTSDQCGNSWPPTSRATESSSVRCVWKAPPKRRPNPLVSFLSPPLPRETPSTMAQHSRHSHPRKQPCSCSNLHSTHTASFHPPIAPPPVVSAPSSVLPNF